MTLSLLKPRPEVSDETIEEEIDNQIFNLLTATKEEIEEALSDWECGPMSKFFLGKFLAQNPTRRKTIVEGYNMASTITVAKSNTNESNLFHRKKLGIEIYANGTKNTTWRLETTDVETAKSETKTSLFINEKIKEVLRKHIKKDAPEVLLETLSQTPIGATLEELATIFDTDTNRVKGLIETANNTTLKKTEIKIHVRNNVAIIGTERKQSQQSISIITDNDAMDSAKNFKRRINRIINGEDKKESDESAATIRALEEQLTELKKAHAKKLEEAEARATEAEKQTAEAKNTLEKYEAAATLAKNLLDRVKERQATIAELQRRIHELEVQLGLIPHAPPQPVLPPNPATPPPATQRQEHAPPRIKPKLEIKPPTTTPRYQRPQPSPPPPILNQKPAKWTPETITQFPFSMLEDLRQAVLATIYSMYDENSQITKDKFLGFKAAITKLSENRTIGEHLKPKLENYSRFLMVISKHNAMRGLRDEDPIPNVLSHDLRVYIRSHF